jgi:hypothetical protein
MSRRGASPDTLQERGGCVTPDETGKEWLKKYAPSELRAERIKMYVQMQGAKTL